MASSVRLIRIGFNSLLVHKLRSLLSVLGIVCGVIAVMTMISTGEGAKQEILLQIEAMGLKNIYITQVTLTEELKKQAVEKRSYGLSFDDITFLKKVDLTIAKVGAVQNSPLTPIGTGRGITPKIVMCTGNYDELLGLSAIKGRCLTEQDTKNNNMVCVLGHTLAKRLGREGQVGKHIRMDNGLYKIVGILNRYDMENVDSKKVGSENFNEILFLPLIVRENSLNSAGISTGYNPLSQIIVEVDEKRNVAPVAELIERALEVSHNGVKDYNMIVPLELLAQSLKTQRVFNLVLAVTGGISLLVGGIGIMNIMLATVTERKQEIGLRRAVGATQGNIATQFLTESVLLTSCGGVIGLVCGLVAISLIEKIAGWPIRVTVVSVLIPILLALFTGIFFGLYPAMQAAKMDPINSLRAV